MTNNLNGAAAHIWKPYASAKNPPAAFNVVSSSGMTIVLDDGTEALDGISSWWCASHGHAQPTVVEAIRQQALQMPHVMFAGLSHEPAEALTQTLLKVLPPGLDKIFYADSGSVAVECALKMAIQYQQAVGRSDRQKIAALKGGYHGDTIGAMSVSDPDGMHAMFQGLLPRQYFAPQPQCRFGQPWDESDFDAMNALLDERGSELAAVIVEPIFQGANAMSFYHPEYLRRLREECNKRGILLIFDEIATGFGRTGELWAQNYAGAKPDIMCIGKALTAGTITLAAAVASSTVADAIPAFMHGPTFMANPLACRAAAAAVRLLDSYDWQGNVKRIESELKAGLEPFRAIPNVRDVRVLGAVGVLEVKQLPCPDFVMKTVRETGVWLRPYGKFVYTMPPFIASTDDVRRIVAAMGVLANAR